MLELYLQYRGRQKETEGDRRRQKDKRDRMTKRQKDKNGRTERDLLCKHDFIITEN